MALIDHPFVRASTIVTLVSAFHQSRAPVVRPVFEGKHGHPVLFAQRIFDDLRAAPPDQGARAVVRGLGARVLDVEVNDPGVTLDIDTPEDYARVLASLGDGNE
jgi:molybdenum cofactor cytidylyltransferase